MNLEGSRDPERMWSVWTLPKGLNKYDAERFFVSNVKPSGYRYEKFFYDHTNGLTKTL